MLGACGQCGVQLAPTDRFCTTCGRPVALPDPPPQTPAPWEGNSADSVVAPPPWATKAPQTAPVGPTTTGGGAGFAAGPGTTSAVPPTRAVESGSGGVPGPVFTGGAQVTVAEDGPRDFDPASLVLAHGEVVKRVHEVGRLRRAAGWLQGTIVVTDARIIYRAKAKNFLNSSTINREIQLADVNGVALSIHKGITPHGLVGWLVGSLIGFFVVSSIVGAATMVNSFGYGSRGGVPWWGVLLYLLFFVVVIWMAVVRFRATSVVLVIYSRNVEASPIALSGQVGSFGGLGNILLAFLGAPLLAALEFLGVYDAAEAADAADLEATQALYEDLGALILDLQSRGVLGAS